MCLPGKEGAKGCLGSGTFVPWEGWRLPTRGSGDEVFLGKRALGIALSGGIFRDVLSEAVHRAASPLRWNRALFSRDQGMHGPGAFPFPFPGLILHLAWLQSSPLGAGWHPLGRAGRWG